MFVHRIQQFDREYYWQHFQLNKLWEYLSRCPSKNYSLIYFCLSLGLTLFCYSIYVTINDKWLKERKLHQILGCLETNHGVSRCSYLLSPEWTQTVLLPDDRPDNVLTRLQRVDSPFHSFCVSSRGGVPSDPDFRDKKGDSLLLALLLHPPSHSQGLYRPGVYQEDQWLSQLGVNY